MIQFKSLIHQRACAKHLFQCFHFGTAKWQWDLLMASNLSYWIVLIVLNVIFCRNCVSIQPSWLLRKPLKYIINITSNGLSCCGCMRQFKTVRNDLFKTQILALVCSLCICSQAFQQASSCVTAGKEIPSHPQHSAAGMMNGLYCQSGAKSLFLKGWGNVKWAKQLLQHYKQT